MPHSFYFSPVSSPRPGGTGAEVTQAVSLGQASLLIPVGRNIAMVTEAKVQLRRDASDVSTPFLELSFGAEDQIRKTVTRPTSS